MLAVFGGTPVSEGGIGRVEPLEFVCASNRRTGLLFAASSLALPCHHLLVLLF